MRTTTNMTCNRLMLLLAAYRGTARDEIRIGTYDSDLAYLLKKGLVTANDNGDVEPTEKGYDMCKSILLKQLV